VHPVRKRLEKELNDLKQRIDEELSTLKQARFAGTSDKDFDEATGVSRASIPGVEAGRAWPRLDTIYLWVTACGSTVQDLFRAPSGEYAEETRHIHRHLEYVLKTQGEAHWLAQAIESAYAQLKPPERKITKAVRASPRPTRGQEDGAQHEAAKTPQSPEKKPKQRSA
jgi:transcriptional regulator with XRE-family HTH domain